MRRTVWAVLAALALLPAAAAPGQAREPEPAALRAFTDLVSAYRKRPALGVETTVTIEVTQDGTTSKAGTAEGRFLFGRDGRSVLELRGFTVWTGDGRVSAVHADRGDAYWTAPDDGSAYYLLLAAFSQIPFPELAIFLGEKEIADLCMQFHQMAPWIQPTGSGTVERDGRTFGSITLSSDWENLVLEYDPESKLIESIVLDVTGGDLVQPGAKLTYTHEYKHETFDAPPGAERFAFDPGERKQVESLGELLPQRAAQGGEGDGPDGGAGGLVGRAAPGLVLATLDGGSVDLEDLRGRVVVLDFWATWCLPCRAALPMLHEVDAWIKQGDVPATVITVNAFEHGEPDERLEKVKSFWQKNRYSLPVAMDYSGDAAGAFGVAGLPTTVVIRSDGVVHAVHAGLPGDYVSSLKAEIEGAIKALEAR
jgi:thiol-disulfide isomerase/thioredoxin